VTAASFTCAICGTQPQIQHWDRRNVQLPPICCHCEVLYTTVHSFPRDRRVGAPKHGSHRDRREAMRLYAITEALETTALRMQWEMPHARA
jgi:hypothetical protein